MSREYGADMNLKDLSAPLKGHQIEFRVARKVSGGSFLLAYKDARVDMQRLDDVCGPLNWKREHSRDNHNCTVSVWDAEHQQWVGKEDTGTESNTEAQKGLASDSFKRACFNWGIGRELYDYPDIYIKHGDNEKLWPKSWDCYNEHDADGRLTFLALRDDKGNVRFQWGTRRE